MFDHDLLIRKFESIAPLSEADRQGLRSISGLMRQLRAYEDVVREGDRPDTVCMIVDGFACRYKILADGKRQIISFHIPGDTPDILSLFLKTMDHNLCALAPTTIAHAPHQVMFDLFARYPSLVQLFWRDTLIDAAIFREWMVGLGRLEAYPRLAHVLCELMTRMKAVGKAHGNTCPFPLTQAEIGDALGMSTVHVNRTLQELRADKLISLQSGVLHILDWEGLERACDFDPSYLHLAGSRIAA